MIEVLAAIGGGSTLALIGLAAYLVYKLVSSKDSQLADRTEALAQKERADGLEVDRDREHTAHAAAESELADVTQRLADTEAHVAELSAKLARAVIARASAPVSQDGADAVNEQLSEPILGDGLEKP